MEDEIGEKLMRALVVDDSSTMRSILRNTLKQRGAEVLEAENGFDALEILKNTDFIDLMLVDWNMPEMNGYELLCKVRSDQMYDEVCIVMVTTETGLGAMTTALKAGANEYIMKPFTPEIVMGKLELIGL
jgi:two-component system, chemotaxis family, chemotaxis protein CheY